MIGYAIENLKKNKRKFSVVFFVLIIAVALIMFSFEVVYNLSEEMKIRATDTVAQDDIESMIMMLIGGVVLLTIFVVVIINNIFSVLMIGREQEFVLLYRLGMTEKRIKRLVIGEVLMISVFSFACGIVLEKALSVLLLSKINLLVHKGVPALWFLLGFIGLAILMVRVVTGNFKIITIKEKKKDSENKHKQKKYIANLAGGLLCFAGAATVGLAGSGDMTDICRYSLVLVGISLISKFVVRLVLELIMKLSEKYRMNSVYLAAKQNIYNMKKMQSAIGTVAIAVAFFVGFKGLYGSIEKTVEKYVNESVNYERLIIFDNVEDLESIASVNSKLEELKGENGKYSVALTEVFSDDEKEFALTLTGVDRSYFEMQRFYMMRDTDQETIFANGSSPRVIFPVKEADSRKFAIGDHVDCYTKDGKNIGFDVSAYYKPINLKQAFTSRESLSRALYGRDDAYNAIFLRGFTTEAEAELLANFKDIKYDVFNMQQIAQESVDKAVNGTEMIEILIYTGMFLVTALVINMFILSIGDRKKQYRQLKMLGEKNGIILKSIMLESGMIYVLGALIGILTAIPAIKIALIMIKEELVFDTVMYVPLPVTAAVSLCMLAVIMAASLMIGRKCTKAKD